MLQSCTTRAVKPRFMKFVKNCTSFNHKSKYDFIRCRCVERSQRHINFNDIIKKIKMSSFRKVVTRVFQLNLLNSVRNNTQRSCSILLKQPAHQHSTLNWPKSYSFRNNLDADMSKRSMHRYSVLFKQCLLLIGFNNIASS